MAAERQAKGQKLHLWAGYDEAAEAAAEAAEAEASTGGVEVMEVSLSAFGLSPEP